MDTDKKNDDNNDERKFTNENHPDREISEENKIIEGDKVMDGGEDPMPPKKKPRTGLIIILIIVIIIALYLSIRGCNQGSDQMTFNFIREMVLWYC